MSVFTVHTDTGRAFALTNEADAVRVALALVRGGHTKHAHARLTGGWTYHANGEGFPDCLVLGAWCWEPAAGLTP